MRYSNDGKFYFDRQEEKEERDVVKSFNAQIKFLDTNLHQAQR